MNTTNLSRDINRNNPHSNQPVLTAGPSPDEAPGTVIFIHGRGASAESILSLRDAIGIENLAGLAPRAAGNSWYPQSFLAPIETNQPYLDSALGAIDMLVTDLEARGITSDRIGILGFSQGACLATEYVARHPRRYGAVVALTGGLIGPPGTPRKYVGSLEGTPVFMGAGDPDPHVPFARVRESEFVLARMGAAVEVRRYPGMPHTVNDEELSVCREYLRSLGKYSTA